MSNLSATARQLLPGGFGRSTFAVSDWCPTAASGAGYLLTTADGRELVDLNNNFTTLVHGHAHPRVVAAAREAMQHGLSYGLPNDGELHHARALLERLPHMDQVRYVNSGTEAVMTAVRLARAHTGRDRVVFVDAAYHGTSDVALPTMGRKGMRGIPRGVLDDIVLVPNGDEQALEAAFDAGEVAAVVMDLLPNRAGLVPLPPAFVTAIETRCRDVGALLIVDEVISLRLAFNGLAAARGVQPDLMTVGKLIGGGLPVGAVLGTREVMGHLDPRRENALEHGGTFSANPVTMASGLATLELYDAPAIEHLNALGARARGRLTERLGALPWEVRGEASLLRPFPRGERTEATAELHRRLWWHAYERGVLLLPNGLATLSTPMTEAVVDHAIDLVADAIAAVEDGAPVPAP